jgi:serine/threonine protein kinase
VEASRTADSVIEFNFSISENMFTVIMNSPWESRQSGSNLICSGKFFDFFKSNFNGQKVVVKRVQVKNISPADLKVEKVLAELKHTNIIKLLQVTENDLYRYYVYEMASATIEDFFDRSYSGEVPPESLALQQMAAGLKYLHEKRLVHLNIKPSSIFITDRLIIGKFQYCESTSDTGLFSISYDNENEKSIWMAPEILEYFDYKDYSEDEYEDEIKKFSVDCDTWSLGCLFYSFLEKGIHPFGKRDDKILWNIRTWQNPYKKLGNSKNPFYELILNMIEFNPKKRITMKEVCERLEHWFSDQSHRE